MYLEELNAEISRETTDAIEYKIASDREERTSAFRLVYESYLRAGLGEPHAAGMRVTRYHLLPTTDVFIARLRGETIFTMTLVIAGELGLPMEAVYPDEVRELRGRGVLAAEISCLADRRAGMRGFFPVFLRLSRLMGQYAWKRGVRCLVAAVHPRHARFYRRVLKFRPIGREKAYPSVRNSPAIALGLDLAALEENHPQMYEQFYGSWLPDEALRPRPLSPGEAAYFRRMIDAEFSLAPLGDSGHAGPAAFADVSATSGG